MSENQDNQEDGRSSTGRKAGGKGSLLVIFLTIFIDLLGFGIVLPLLPIYADQFATDPGGWIIGLLMASFSIMQFLFAPIWGALSDRIGRRPVIIVGLIGSVVFYLLFAVATIYHSLTMLFVTRIGAGIAGATVSTAQAYIADTTDNESRARGMALVGMAFGLGFTLGPLFAVFAVPGGDSDPGPGPGFVAAALSAVALGMAIFLLPESRVSGQSASAVKKWWDAKRLRMVVGNRAIGILLLAFFVCIFSFANFETTLSLLLKGPADFEDARFHFTFKHICYTFALIGFLVAAVQGGVVRPLTKYVSPANLAIFGASTQVIGFSVLTWSILFAPDEQALTWLFVALVISVVGYACLQPNLYALLSRWSDPQRQGETLGVGQSVNALARIFGSALGIPLLKTVLFLPYLVAAVMMFLVALLVFWASRIGSDFHSPGGEDDVEIE